MQTMECEMYDKVAEYLTLMSRTELLTCSASQSSFNKIKEQATTVSDTFLPLSLTPVLIQSYIEFDFLVLFGIIIWLVYILLCLVIYIYAYFLNLLKYTFQNYFYQIILLLSHSDY